MDWLRKALGGGAPKTGDNGRAPTSEPSAAGSPPLELPQDVHERIKAFCAEGDRLADAEAFEEAIKTFNEAWRLIPSPKYEWETSTWVLAALADACFLGDFLDSAREALEYAMQCPGAIGNPFLHLRFGQVLLEDGEKDRAADELARAYMGAGEEIFADEDPKYRAFLATRMKI